MTIGCMITKQYITIVHYIWRGFESWYLLCLLPFHQDLWLLFSAFLGLEWLGFAKTFPSNRISYVSFKYYRFLWIRICQFGKEPVIFDYSIVSRGAWQKKNGFRIVKVKMVKFATKTSAHVRKFKDTGRWYTSTFCYCFEDKHRTCSALPTHLLICWRLETNFL